jgi:hypothetical protein
MYSPEKETSSESLAKRVSLLMTKPENTDTEAPLLLFLKNNNLEAKTFRFTLTEEILLGLYPGIQDNPEMWQMTKDHMLGKEVEVFLVTRDSKNDSDKSVLEQVVNLVGSETNPEENKEGTLRRHMSADSPFANYFKNGFHRPKTPEELVKNLEVFGLMEEVNKI